MGYECSIKSIDIETQFIQPETGKETGEWIEVNRPVDCYSFQLSFVFPNWIHRFQNENFRKLIYNIISSELPAHITPYYHWLDRSQMQDFERAYTHWLNTIMDKKPQADSIKNTGKELIRILKIGNVGITPFNVLGYMTIGTDFIVS